MGKIEIVPNSERARMDYTAIQENFFDVLKVMSNYSELSMQKMGFDWNFVDLMKGRKGVDFFLGSENVGGEGLEGTVRDKGRQTPIITANDSSIIGASEMTPNYITRSLREAFDIARKLEIHEDTEFLPSAESSGIVVPRGEGSGVAGKPDQKRFKAFASELLNSAKSIIVGRKHQEFGNYIVAETNQGWFIAYNKNYGEGPYIVDDLDMLIFDKSTLRDSGEAIRHRRDPRGDWVKTLRQYL